MRDTTTVVIRFADVTIDAAGHEVRRAGELLGAEPQVLDLLLYLIEHRDRVVTKIELLDAIWHHRFVTESALSSRIKSVRQLIGDNGRDQRFIRTVHGRGYRFVATIEDDDASLTAGARPADLNLNGGDEPPDRRRVPLPVQTTPFVGRKAEQRLILEQLADPACRLLTIVGPGGIGKTRLALAVAEQAGSACPDGVFFVSCATVPDAAQMVYALADRVGISLDASIDPAERLLSSLARKEMLIVLDNMEHLTGIDLIADILAAAPSIGVLATSRERLNLRAEWLFELAGLALPGTEPGDASSDAVELFARSGRKVRPDFSLDKGAEEAVGRICRLVEGMPLALELAAGWLKLLSLDEIIAEIEGGLDFLETDLRDVPERHRSIRNVFDASWKRLSPEEQGVFMRLSVFRGGFDREEAHVIAGAGLPVLRSLTAKSMIARTHDHRYVIHELLRQFGEQRLADAELLDDVRRLHSEHFLCWLSDQASALKGVQQRVAVSEIASSMDNVRAAWSDAIERGRVELLAGATESLWLYFDTRGISSEIGPLCRDALTVLEEREPPSSSIDVVDTAVVGLLRAGEGMGLAQQGALEEGRLLLEAGLRELLSCAEDPRHASKLALGHLWLGWVNFLLARNDEAADHAEAGLMAFAGTDDHWGVARCHFLLGNNHTAMGRLKPAETSLQACRSIVETIGDHRGSSLVYRNLSILAGWFGDFQEAETLLNKAVEISEQSDDRLGLAYALREIGKVRQAEGLHSEALSSLERSIAITDDIGNDWESAATADDLGNAYAAIGDFDAAERALTRCLNGAKASTNRYYVARCVGDLGALALRRGDTQEAERLLRDALAQWQHIGHEPYTAWALMQLGHVASLDDRRRDEAARFYAAGLELAIRHELAPFAIELLVGAAVLGVPASGVERESLLHLVANHPASTSETRDRARAMSPVPEVADPDRRPPTENGAHANDLLWTTAAATAERLRGSR